MLNWFDLHSSVYWWIVCSLIGLHLFFIFRPFFGAQRNDRGKADWWWGAAILGLVAAGRWPTWFVTWQLNDDESFLITGARTLRHDPIFWRSVDGGTAGPLNFYALLPIGTLTGSDSYFSARITACVLISIALVLTYQSLSILFGRQIGRATIFSAVCVESLTYHSDLLHYSTELVAMCLFSGVFFLYTKCFISEQLGAKGKFIAGLALGAMPFAKLQSVPIGLCLGLAWIASAIICSRDNKSTVVRNVAPILLGTITPPMLVAAVCLYHGLGPYVYTSYISNNLLYAGQSFDVSIRELIANTSAYAAAEVSLLFEWFIGGIILVLLLIPFSRLLRPKETLFAAASISLLFSAVVAVLLPHRPFLHYWQLTVVPWTLVIGCSIGFVIQSLPDLQKLGRCLVVSLSLGCTVIGVYYTRADVPMPARGRLAAIQLRRGPLAREIDKFAKPGEYLGIWGWMSSIGSESGMIQATRRMATIAEIDQNSLTVFFREIYLHDLISSRPIVFVDAVGKGSLVYTGKQYSFRTSFPALNQYIQDNYTAVTEIDGNRIYIRNDRLRELQPSGA